MHSERRSDEPGTTCRPVPDDESPEMLLDSDGSLLDSTVNASDLLAVSMPLNQKALEQPRTSGRYHLVEVVGRGAFGEVWKAFDPVLQRIVAVKTIRSDRQHAHGPERFLDEGRKLAQLIHPGIVTVFDVGEEHGEFFIVSQFIEGTTLAQRLMSGPVDWRFAVCLIASVAEAAHAAHLAGIVHRDIKPSNILLDSQETPFLADFGIAATEEEQLVELPSTSGTLPYMSPEQVHGHSHLADARSDVYSLGVVLYELLAGRLPFVARSLSEYRHVVGLRLPRPPRTIRDNFPASVEAVCLKALAPIIVQRHSTAKDFAAELRTCLDTTPHPSTQDRLPPTTVHTLLLPQRRFGSRVTLAILLAGFVAWLGWYNAVRPPDGDPVQGDVAGVVPEPHQPRHLLAKRPVVLLPSAQTTWQHTPQAELLTIQSESNLASLIGLGESSATSYQIETVLQVAPLPEASRQVRIFLVYGACESPTREPERMKWSGESLLISTASLNQPASITRCRNEFLIPVGSTGVMPQTEQLDSQSIPLVVGAPHTLKWTVGARGIEELWWDGKFIANLSHKDLSHLTGVTPLIGTQLGVLVQSGTLRLSRADMTLLSKE